MAAIDSDFARPETHDRRSASEVALLLVMVVVGYEWLVSGLSKLANGDFANGLAAQLGRLAGQAPPWYGHFLRTAIVPHAVTFGYLIEVAELLVGVVLVGVAFTELAAGGRLTRQLSRQLRRLAVAALAVGIVLAVNFELANGGGFGLRLAADSFDEGVDLDTVMVAAQLALLVAFLPAVRPAKQREGG
jgi:thiosulfate dehydrogenase [quinone] large subunit